MTEESLEKNELEVYADQVADQVFVPLADFEVWYLEQVRDYPCYWAALAREIVDHWQKPEEDETVKHNFVQVFPNPRYERKT